MLEGSFQTRVTLGGCGQSPGIPNENALGVVPRAKGRVFMTSIRRVKWVVCAAALAVVAMLAPPAAATTMIRMGLDELAASNRTIVVGQVVGLRSYWNADRSFILTDVRVLTRDLIKGDPGRREFTFTIMGGTVGEMTTLIVAGPEVQAGSEYLMFLNHEDLPGVSQVLTVRDISQGIFDVVPTPSGKLAMSQASRHPLLADKRGLVEPPGGKAGIRLDDAIRELRSLVSSGTPSVQID